MLSLIVIIDKNNLIGNDNRLPWHFPEDLIYFKNKTVNHKVIMGDNTFQSVLSYLGSPFRSRTSIVVTDQDYKYDNVRCFDNLDDVIELYKNCEEEVFVAGGKSIYEQLLPHCQRLYITHINDEYVGNVFFPTINYDNYDEISSTTKGILTFSVYEVKKND